MEVLCYRISYIYKVILADDLRMTNLGILLVVVSWQ